MATGPHREGQGSRENRLAAPEAHLELTRARPLSSHPGDDSAARAERGRAAHRRPRRKAAPDREPAARRVERVHRARVEIDQPGGTVGIVDDGDSPVADRVEAGGNEGAALTSMRAESSAGL